MDQRKPILSINGRTSISRQEAWKALRAADNRGDSRMVNRIERILEDHHMATMNWQHSLQKTRYKLRRK